jgi:flagellar L-ring protein precursor FlgH
MNVSAKFQLVTAAVLLSASAAFAGSLWTEGKTDERGMFSDKLARRVGDIVTVVIDENTSANNSLKLTTSRTASAGAGTNPLTYLINQFVTALPSSILGKNKAMAAVQKAGVPGSTVTAPTVDVAGSSDYTGGGTITNTQTVSSRAAVTVVDVLPNGNLIIEGVRMVRFSGETQYASLRGVIRPTDVLKDNTVVSTNIADAQVEFVSEGSLSEAQKKGWLLRLSNKVSPF